MPLVYPQTLLKQAIQPSPACTLMNFFFQILWGRGLLGPSSACWFTRLSYSRPDMVLLKLFMRSAGSNMGQMYG